MRKLAILSGVVCALALAAPAAGGVLYWNGGTGGDWSDPGNWMFSGGIPAGAYPAAANDVGVIDGHDEQAVYDASASGIVGGMQIVGQYDNARITIARDTLVDCTGTTGDALTPAGWIFAAPDDSTSTGFYIDDGVTLTITGYKSATNNTNCWSQNYGPGTLRFAPDAGGRGYLYLGGARAAGFHNMALDLSALTVMECMDDTGSAAIAHDLSVAARNDCNNVADSKPIIIGRADGATQTFGADASLAGTDAGRRITVTVAGMEGRYGPHLLVQAVGTDAAPNLVVFEAEAIAGLNFPKNTFQGGGGWIQHDPATTGVARLVLEGDFVTDDHYAVDALWDMTHIQLQLAGEKLILDPSLGVLFYPNTYQQLTWPGEDRNSGGTLPMSDPDYFGGFDANYAVRKLILGSDEGTDANAASFLTTADGSAMYVFGLEFLAAAWLRIEDPGDFLYYLGDLETVNGTAGMGLQLPVGTQLSDFTNRPENIIMVGVPEPSSALVLVLGVCGLLRRRRHGV